MEVSEYLLYVGFLILSSRYLSCQAASWSYGSGATAWGGMFPVCNQDRQSPIDLTGATPQNLGPLVLNNYDNPSTGTIAFSNGGHGITVSELLQSASVSGGGLPSSYNLLQFHYHWGPTLTSGSEHTIDGKHSAMELHLVYVKDGFTVAQALGISDGLAVLGIMIDEDDPAAPCNDPFFTAVADLALSLSDANETSGTISVNNFSLDALLPTDTGSFYRYLGSLTTPSCQEAVVWTVFATPVKKCLADINKWRSYKDYGGGELMASYRPVQPRNGRELLINQASSSGVAGTSITQLAQSSSSFLVW